MRADIGGEPTLERHFQPEDAVCLLEALAAPNRDDGVSFTDTARLDAIAGALRGTPFGLVGSGGLFRLYAQAPIGDLPERVVLVSSHVDCEAGMDRCFSEDMGCGMLKGTFDNLATNAAIVAIMREGLPRNVVVAFTGDEERDSAGARQTFGFLEACGKRVALAVVLDVTDMGWVAGLDFTIENDFCDVGLMNDVARAISEVSSDWEVVPVEIGWDYGSLPRGKVAAVPAMPDESWEYDEQGAPCFSLCVPVEGDMHSGDGVLMRKDGFMRYVEALRRVLVALAGRPESVQNSSQKKNSAPGGRSWP